MKSTKSLIELLIPQGIPVSCKKKEIYLTMAEVKENECYNCPRVGLYVLLEKDRRNEKENNNCTP